MDHRCKTIIVEGLISSGKTTLTRELGRALGPATLVLMEPDEKAGANPYLADYYAEPERWSCTMQVHMLSLRFRMHLLAQWHVMEGRGHAVMDRSFYGDTAFARLQLALGLLSEREFSTYSKLYHAMTASVLLPTICLRTLISPATAIRRIESRMLAETGRKCEIAISLEYLHGLDREIDHMVAVLRQQGVVVMDVPWDEKRDSEETRAGAIEGIAARINSLEPADAFLDMHRRSM